MLKFMNIRAKLFILVLMVLVPLILLSCIKIRKEFDNKIESELSSYQDLAEAISTSFNNYVNEIWVQEAVIGTFLTEHQDLTAEEIQSLLISIQRKEKTLSSVSLFSPEGIVTASSISHIVGKSYSDREYMAKIQEGQDQVISNLVESKAYPGTYIIPVIRAIKKDGKLVGIISAVIDVDQLAVKLPKLKISDSSRFFLVDHSGKIVYRNDDSIPPIGYTFSSDSPVWRTLEKGTIYRSNQFVSSFDGIKRICVNYPIKGIGWACTISSSYNEVMSKYYHDMTKNIIILILVSLASIAAAFYFGNRLLSPISRLQFFAKKVMEGDYTVRTQITGCDELATTAKAFDSMVEGIEQNDRFKSQFFTNISHELKTPLNVIFASVQLIANIQDSMDYHSYRNKINKQLKIIKQNCYRLMRIINNLIDISRYDSGYLVLKPENYDIVRIVKEITESVMKYAEAKGIEIIFDTDVEEKVISCDPDTIERIILNLISNAIKFTEVNGNIRINIFDKQQTVVISIKDTGIGIPNDKLCVIFERFRQVDDSLNRNHEGSGIGLSLVKALVEAHKGTIQVISEPDKGSEFIIELPAIMVPQTDQDNKQKKQTSYPNFVSRINIEFSDIYSIEEIN